MSRIGGILTFFITVIITILTLASCAPSLYQQIEADRAKADMYQAQAAVIRAEGDAALIKAQAYDLTVRTQADARLLAIADRQNDLIDNTYWLNWLVFVLILLVLILIGLQVWQLIELRKAVKYEQANC